MNSAEAKRILETALICAQQPLPLREMRVLFDEQVGADTLRVLLDELGHDWRDRGVELVPLATGWRFQSRPEMRVYLDRLHPEKPPKYSRAAMETLAIIAYKQPVTRGDIEDIRGVTVSSQIVKQLEDRGWVEVIGHREAIGRPALYATTQAFLDDLGLTSLEQLPPLEAHAVDGLPSFPPGVADAFGTTAEQGGLAGASGQGELPLDEHPAAEPDGPPAAADTVAAGVQSAGAADASPAPAALPEAAAQPEREAPADVPPAAPPTTPPAAPPIGDPPPAPPGQDAPPPVGDPPPPGPAGDAPPPKPIGDPPAPAPGGDPPPAPVRDPSPATPVGDPPRAASTSAAHAGEASASIDPPPQGDQP